jgi:hypothetical protein
VIDSGLLLTMSMRSYRSSNFISVHGGSFASAIGE